MVGVIKMNDQPLKILLVDDHALLRKGVKAMIDTRPDFKVIGEASNGCDAVELARKLQPDVIFMDINLPGLNGLKATYTIKKEFPSIAIVMLTVSDNESQLFNAIKCGASGYLLKTLEPEELFNMLDRIKQGEVAFNGEQTTKILKEFNRLSQVEQKQWGVESLSEREIEVLKRLVLGEDNKEIALALSISVSTVKSHLRTIMEKLHLKNRIETAVFAIGEGLVDYHKDCPDQMKDI